MIIYRQKNYSKKSPVVYLLVGLPGSGKSTWCKENYPNLPIVSRDIIRNELGYTNSVDQKAVLSRNQEEKVTEREYKMIEELAQEEKDFIIDDTNLKRKYRIRMVEFLKDLGVYICMVYFNTPLSVCIERRTGQIDPSVMRNLRIEKPQKNEYDRLIEI